MPHTDDATTSMVTGPGHSPSLASCRMCSDEADTGKAQPRAQRGRPAPVHGSQGGLHLVEVARALLRIPARVRPARLAKLPEGARGVAAAPVAQLLQLLHLRSRIAHRCVPSAALCSTLQAPCISCTADGGVTAHQECVKVGLGAQKILEATGPLELNASLQGLGL